MPEGNDDRIVIQCECGAKLKVPASAAGKKGRCPKCKATVSIPLPQEEPSDDSGGPISLAPGLDEDSLLDELAAQAQSAPQVAPPGGGKKSQPCPACDSTIPDGAALCVSCGYNLLTGKKTKAASARKADAAAATRRFALGAGTFALGCALSFAGAMVGAVLWSIVSVITEYEIGYIAWGLGVLAGGGMVLGYRTGNLRAGVAAAGIAIVGIVAAKATVFVYLSYPELQQMQHIADAMSDEYVEDRARLAEHRTGLRTRRMGLSYVDDRNEEIYDEEFYNVLKFNNADLIDQIEQLDAWEAGGRWSDAEFVCGYLIYDHIDKGIQSETEKTGSDSDAEPWEPSPSDWSRLHDSARQTVDGLADEDRLLQAKEIERDRERNMQSMRLAFHQHRIDNIDNLSAASDGSLEELQTHFRSMSEQDRKAALAELAAWNRGAKWDDVEYVRSAAINERIEKAIQERNEATEDQDAEWWEPSQEERNVLRDEAARAVDALPHDRRVDQLKSEKAKQKARFEEYRGNNSKAISDEIAGEAFTFFVQNYFGAMDLLFAALALGSAFKIAAGGGSDD